jgi:hypothetical protein
MPLTTGPQHVQNRVDNFALFPFGGSSPRQWGWNERNKLFPFFITQISAIWLAFVHSMSLYLLQQLLSFYPTFKIHSQGNRNVDKRPIETIHCHTLTDHAPKNMRLIKH